MCPGDKLNMFQNGPQFVSPTHHDSYQAIVCNNKQRPVLHPVTRPSVRHSDNCANTFSMQSRECALMLVKLHKMSEKIRVTFSFTKTNTQNRMSALKMTVSKTVGNRGCQAWCVHISFSKLLSALPGNLFLYLSLSRY